MNYSPPPQCWIICFLTIVEIYRQYLADLTLVVAPLFDNLQTLLEAVQHLLAILGWLATVSWLVKGMELKVRAPCRNSLSGSSANLALTRVDTMLGEVVMLGILIKS